MNLRNRPKFSIIVSLVCVALLLAPALACNLPSRQAPILVFPTSLPALTSTTLTAAQPEITLPPAPATTSLPAPMATSTPTLPATPISAAPYTFMGLQTATPGPIQPESWTALDEEAVSQPFMYWTQPGDTLFALAARFGVTPDQISPPQPAQGLLIAGQSLAIPNLLGIPPYTSALMPDSAIIYSPMAAKFDIEGYITQAGGYLKDYTQMVGTDDWLNGAQVVRRVAEQTSVNPQVLLAFLEFRSGWVRGQPADPAQVEYPIGFYVPEYRGLYLELSLVAKQLNMGYYGWREGTLTDLTFPDGSHLRLSPGLNAGSVALLNLSSKFYRHQDDWLEALYGAQGFLALYRGMFGDPWLAAADYEPLFPPNLEQPTLELPFAPGEEWSLTAGPHIAWNTGTPRGALDFAPITGESPCKTSFRWVTASAPGLVVRSGNGVVVLDLDGDGLEQTGWDLVYMHLADQGRVPLGATVQLNEPLGHPSCEGGNATGTNVHLARKYNGEWIAADGPLPMVLSGWIAHADQRAYYGTLEKDGQVVSAHPDGSAGSTIIR